MTANPNENQKKIRRLGNVLQWVAGMGGVLLVLLMAGLALFAGGIVDIFHEYAEQDLRGFLTTPFGNTDYTEVGDVSQLLAQDKAFFEDHRAWIGVHAAVATLVFGSVLFFVIRLARCWRRGDVFGDRPIRSLRWIGLIALIHAGAGLIYAGVAPYSPLTLLPFGSYLHDLLIMIVVISPFGGFTFGLVTLTMSWVLEYGRHLRDEQALVV